MLAFLCHAQGIFLFQYKQKRIDVLADQVSDFKIQEDKFYVRTMRASY
jgi:hypothetical protein